MTPGGARDLYAAGVFYAFMGLSALFTAAGGLGLAASAGFIGLFWLPVLIRPAFGDLRRPPLAALVIPAFIAWSALSLSWSSYDRPDQALKLVLLTPLFALAVYGVTRLGPQHRGRLAAFTAGAAGLVGVFFLIEGLFGAPISQWEKTALSGAPPGPEALALAHRTLSRGASAFILIAGPVAIGLWMAGRRAAAAFVSLCAVVASASFGVEANIAALAAGTLAGAAALKRPRLALAGLLSAIALVILITPLILGAIVVLTPQEFAEALPLSWHQRIEIWRYALARLSEAPLFGHGLDASRMMEDEMMLRGQPLSLVPLHPHNGGLHIWLETGFIGAALAAAGLLLLARRVLRKGPGPAVAAGAAFAVAAWFTLTTLGYGVWQEWHHGALALALAAALLNGTATRPA